MDKKPVECDAKDIKQELKTFRDIPWDHLNMPLLKTYILAWDRWGLEKTESHQKWTEMLLEARTKLRILQIANDEADASTLNTDPGKGLKAGREYVKYLHEVITESSKIMITLHVKQQLETALDAIQATFDLYRCYLDSVKRMLSSMHKMRVETQSLMEKHGDHIQIQLDGRSFVPIDGTLYPFTYLHDLKQVLGLAQSQSLHLDFIGKRAPLCLDDHRRIVQWKVRIKKKQKTLAIYNCSVRDTSQHGKTLGALPLESFYQDGSNYYSRYGSKLFNRTGGCLHFGADLENCLRPNCDTCGNTTDLMFNSRHVKELIRLIYNTIS